MKKLISCAFNIDTACVELHFTDGSIYSINCTAVENEVADNRFQRAELDYLIYNDPLAYSSNLVKRQQLRERGQEPIKTEYSRQGRFQQGMLHRSGFCSKILNFPKSRARKIERKTALLRGQRQRDSKTDSGNQWSR